MATTITLPVQIRNPQQGSNAGNSYPIQTNLTNWEIIRPGMKTAAAGNWYGLVRIPPNVAGTPNAKIIGTYAWNATTGNSVLTCATQKFADAASIDVGALNAETNQTITVPGTARVRKDVTFPTSGSIGTTVAAGDMLIVRLGQTSAGTVAVDTEIVFAVLQIDIA